MSDDRLMELPAWMETSRPTVTGDRTVKKKETPMQAAVSKAAKLEKLVDKLRMQVVRLEERLAAREAHIAYLERLPRPQAEAEAKPPEPGEADIASLLGVPASDAA